MTNLYFVLYFLISVPNTHMQLTINEKKTSSELSDCFHHIFSTYWPSTKKLLVLYNPDCKTIVSDLLQRLELPVLLNAEEMPMIRGLDSRSPNQVGIFMDDSFNVSQMLSRALWNADTHFFMVIPNGTNALEKIRDKFYEFWDMSIVNILVLLVQFDDISFYSFEPFVDDCKPGPPLLKATWSSGRFQTGEIESLVRKNEVAQLHGCPLNVTVVDLTPTVIFLNPEDRNGTSVIDGIESRALIEISKKMNFKPHFAVAKDGEAWGWIEPSPHGVVGEVFKGESQIGLGLLASTLERYEYLDMTFPVSPVMECITWAVPIGARGQQAVWINILIAEFNRYVWYGILTSSALVYILFRVISGSQEHTKWERRKYGAFYIFSASLGVPVPTPIRLPLRILFLAWLWYSFIIITAYQSYMGSKLTIPLPLRQVNTFRDLLDSGLHLTGFYNTFRLVSKEADDADVREIAKRLEPTNYNIAEAVNKIITDRNIAYMRESTTFLYQTLINPHAKGYVHIMKQCVYVYYSSMVLKKKCCLTRGINKIIRRLFEGGITKQWRSEFLYPVPVPPAPVTKLSFHHLRGSFTMLLVGHGLASIVFLGEHVYHRDLLRRFAKRISCNKSLKASF